MGVVLQLACLCVCLFVCLSSRISQKLQDQISQNSLHMLLMTVARCSTVPANCTMPASAAEHHRPLAGTHFTLPWRVEGWVDRSGWLHTEIKCRLRESNPWLDAPLMTMRYVAYVRYFVDDVMFSHNSASGSESQRTCMFHRVRPVKGKCDGRMLTYSGTYNVNNQSRRALRLFLVW